MNNMTLSELGDEKTKYLNLQKQVSSLITELTNMTNSLKSCSTNLKTGFLIDEVGVDVYAFGGFESYATENIEPVIEMLNTLDGNISDSVKTINSIIAKKEEEERERKYREARERNKKKEEESKEGEG